MIRAGNTLRRARSRAAILGVSARSFCGQSALSTFAPHMTQMGIWTLVPGCEDGGGSLHRHRWDDGHNQSSVTEGPCELKSVCVCIIHVMIIIYLSICIFLFSYVYTRSALGLILFSLDPTLFFKFFFLGSLNPHILISLSLVWNFSARTVSEA